MKLLAVLLFSSALLLPGLSRPDAPAAQAVLPAPGTYQVDPVHSTVLFRVGHLGVSNFYGRFNGVSGSFTWAEDPAKASVQITLRAEDLDTGEEGRDQHLKGPDFFNARQFPEVTFTSTSVTRGKDGLLEVTGDLTLHGVTRSITVHVEPIGAGERGARFGYRAGLDAAFTIRRSDFGLDTFVKEGMLGDAVKILVSLEGQRR